jgi:hypothetical protein
MTATAIAPDKTPARLSTDAFLVWMAFACVAISFGGFSMEYFATALSGKLVVPPIYHIHGTTALAWTVFLWVQAMFIANGQTLRHRRVGLIGISLATLVTVSGLLISIASIKIHSVKEPIGPVLTFSVVPVMAALLFAGLVIAALVLVRHRESHKRLMLVATLSILEAPIARVFGFVLTPPNLRDTPLLDMPTPPLDVTTGPYIVVDVLILVAMAFDWRTRGRPHPALVIGALFVVASQLSRFAIGPTAAWHDIATWMVSLAG